MTNRGLYCATPNLRALTFDYGFMELISGFCVDLLYPGTDVGNEGDKTKCKQRVNNSRVIVAPN